MGTAHQPVPVKLVASLLSSDRDLLDEAKSALSRIYGAVDFESALLPFDHTDYYTAEFGRGLERKIVEVFQRFGFQPVETPTLEYAALILGKYGEEADRLVYTFEDRGKRMVALPYDQTVPTARVLTQYRRDLPR